MLLLLVVLVKHKQPHYLKDEELQQQQSTLTEFVSFSFLLRPQKVTLLNSPAFGDNISTHGEGSAQRRKLGKVVAGKKILKWGQIPDLLSALIE